MSLASRARPLLLLLCALCILAPTWPTARAATVEPQPQRAPAPVAPAQASLDYVVVGGVRGPWALAPSRALWFTLPQCSVIPSLNAPSAGEAERPVELLRVRTAGGEFRVVFSRNDPRPPGTCNPYSINSNIVTDSSYVYWMDDQGLVRLPLDASPGTFPELLNPNYRNLASFHWLAIGAGTIYAASGQYIWSSPTSVLDGGTTLLTTTYSSSGVAFDGELLYFINQDNLYWMNIGGGANFLAANVTAFAVDGLVNRCVAGNCNDTRYVFAATNYGGIIERFDLAGGATRTVYTPALEPNTRVRITTIDSTASTFNPRLFYFEQITDSNCATIVCDASHRLARSNYNGGDRAVLVANTSDSAKQAKDLIAREGYLFYRQYESILRIPADATALPQVNVRALGMMITQGVQKYDNSAPMVRGRRTFVRLLANADAARVDGITARLYGTATGIDTSIPLLPINQGWPSKSVQVSPNELDINEGFWFELPTSWTNASDLRLRGVINPFNVPAETNRGDNETNNGPWNFQPSPRLVVNFVGFSYTLTGTLRTTNVLNNMVPAAELVRNLFPLDSSPGWYSGAGTPPGFRPVVMEARDEGIGPRMFAQAEPPTATYQPCAYLLPYDSAGKLDLKYDSKGKLIGDNRNLCAAGYVNGQLAALRTARQLPADSFMYGFIPEASGLRVRGLASGYRTSSGDANNPYTAAHEIAHTLRRDHPFRGSALESKVCNNTTQDGPMDSSFPYKDSQIGTDANYTLGLEISGRYFGTGGRMALLPGTTYDFIGYCRDGNGRAWVSDYSYRCMLIYLNTEVTPPACGGPLVARPAWRASQQALDGDWLSVVGMVAPGGQAAQIIRADRLASVAEQPAQTAGDYALHLLGANGTLLASHPFAAPTSHHRGGGGFNLVVPFVAGTSELRVVRVAQAAAANAASLICLVGPSATGERILASQPVSANAPTLSAVAVQEAEPLYDVVTLTWSASDADNDTLRYDILWSRDGGASFVPFQLGVSGTSAAIDTSSIDTPSGGSAIFRVIASDGVQTAQADSAGYQVVHKPHQPRILSPENGAQYQYGQVITLRGEADDPQTGGSISAANLYWSDANGRQLGTGPTISVSDLPVGNNTLRFTALNADNVDITTEITVFVGDELADPGPLLSVGPAAISRHIAAGDATLQTAPLTITNSGGGAFSWTASSDQSWLTLDATSGSDPAQLTLTANPAGFAEGQVYRAEVTISATPNDGSAAQSVTVPVSIAVGNTAYPVSDAAVTQGQFQVWLPLARR